MSLQSVVNTSLAIALIIILCSQLILLPLLRCYWHATISNWKQSRSVVTNQTHRRRSRSGWSGFGQTTFWQFNDIHYRIYLKIAHELRVWLLQPGHFESPSYTPATYIQNDKLHLVNLYCNGFNMYNITNFLIPTLTLGSRVLRLPHVSLQRRFK